MRTLTVLALLALAAGAAAEARRPMTFDDFIRLQRVSDPQLAPDGRRVVFTVQALDKSANTRNDDLWIVEVAGGEPRRLTSHPKSDRWAAWAPDGRRLAFVSSRAGAPQIFVLSFDGGEPRQVTTLKAGVEGRPVWSRDGRLLLFPSMAYPGCQDEACNARRADAAEATKASGRLYDELPVRLWDSWRDPRRSHLFVVDAEGQRPARDLTPGAKDVPPIDLTGPADYDFAPDGREVAFTRVDEPPAWSTNSDVYVVPTAGGAAKKISQSPGSDTFPRYSPDGRFIAFRSTPTGGYESETRRLWLYDRRSGAATNLTGGLDVSVEDFEWSHDGRTLYFDADQGGYRPIWAVDVAGGAAPRVLVQRRFTHGFGVAPDGTVVYAAESADRPAEIYRHAGGRETALTHFNDARLAALDLKPVEWVTHVGAKGARIETAVVKPPGFTPGKRYPLLLILHGGPQSMMGDDWHWRWNYQMFARAGYVVAAPNFHGSSGFGSALQDAIRGDWGGAPYEDVMTGVAHLATLPYVDGQRVAAAGASYGGYLINWIAGHTDRFRALITHDGLFNLSSMNAATEELWFPEWEFRGAPWESRELHDRLSPSRYAEKIKTPMLVIHGEQDMRVPVEEALQLFGTLKRRGVPARLLVFPDEGHFVLKPANAELWWATMHAWLGKHLK